MIKTLFDIDDETATEYLEWACLEVNAKNIARMKKCIKDSMLKFWESDERIEYMKEGIDDEFSREFKKMGIKR